MNEQVRRFREPALIIALIVTAANWVMSIVVAATADGTLVEAAQQAGSKGTMFFWVLVVLLLALSTTAKPQTPNSGKLIRLSAVLTTLAALTSLVFLVMTLSAGLTVGIAFAAVGGVLDILVKGSAAAALWSVIRKAVPAKAATPELPKTGAHDQLESGRPPVWQPSDAVGFQWSRAGDAAAGGTPDSAKALAEVPELEPAEPKAPVTPWSRGGIVAAEPEAAAAPETAKPAADNPWPTAGQFASGAVDPADSLADKGSSDAPSAGKWAPLPPEQR